MLPFALPAAAPERKRPEMPAHDEAKSAQSAFAAIEPGLRSLAEHGEIRRYQKGAILITEGDRNETMFVVLSGSVRVYSVDERDREITYGIVGAGETLGEMALDGGPRSASAVALEPCVCAAITRSELLAKIAADPSFALALIVKVIGIARITTRTARSMALLDVYGRVAALLDSLAVARPDGSRVISPRPTHADIASRVGCSREMVSRLIKDLRVGGYLREEPTSWVLSARGLPAHW